MQPPHPNHVILLGSSARAATASAVAAGYGVTAVDAFGDADLREMCQSYHPLPSAGLPLAFLRSHEPSTIVPLGGCERWTDPIASLSNRHRIAGATRKQWRLVNDLRELTAIANSGSVRVPESRTVVAVDASRSCSPSSSPARWLIKAPFSCGGLGVRWSEIQSVKPGDFYQRWIQGTAVGASYLATNADVHLLGVCRTLKFRTSSHPAIYAGSCGPLPIGPEWTERLLQLGSAAANRLELRCLFNIDLVLHPVDGPYLLEINPRYSASMELLEPGASPQRAGKTASAPTDLGALIGELPTEPRRSLLAAHLACYSGSCEVRLPSLVSTPSAGNSRQRVRCKRVIFSERELVFDADTRRRIRAVIDAHHADWADIPAEGTAILCQHPVLSIFTRANSAGTAIRRAARIKRALRPYLGGASN